ncbi:alpha/beta fold hydrolase [Paenibacillus hodogayensis]|uniref:Alpha/beta fold hydrolase n=1 Tax=Paenibacillus hodogayensis TaxID=279208 RepID=A0ABV5VUA1_9BACL
MPIAVVNGTHLYYQIQGKGTPILFIHPPLLTSHNFRYQQVQLAGEFSVITFDVRGHGKSAVSETPLTYGLIVEDIVRLLDYLGIRQTYICGYSTGGSVALEAMLTHPDRFAGGILVSTMSEASDFLLRSRIRLAAGLSATKPLARLLMWGIAWGNADSNLTFRNLLREARRGNQTNIRQYYRYSLRYNCTQRLDRLRIPTLLVYGEKDRGFKRYRRKLENELPVCDVVVLKDEKHQIPTKSALEMNESIRTWVREAERRKNPTVSKRQAEPNKEPAIPNSPPDLTATSAGEIHEHP